MSQNICYFNITFIETGFTRVERKKLNYLKKYTQGSKQDSRNQ